MSGDLAGRTVLLTGASGGLGRVFAHALVGVGANLVLTGRRPKPLAEVAAEVDCREDRLVVAPADVTDPAAMPRVVEIALARFGAVDVLVNNAGVGGPVGPMWDTDPDSWCRAVEVNLYGTARACQAVLPGMVARRSGRIINIVSAAGRYRWPHVSAYSVAKAGIIKLTENLAAELRPHGVCVFSLHPGLLDLGLTAAHLAKGPVGDRWADEVYRWVRRQHELGKFTPPRQAAELLLFLASGAADESSGEYFAPEDATLPTGMASKTS